MNSEIPESIAVITLGNSGDASSITTSESISPKKKKLPWMPINQKENGIHAFLKFCCAVQTKDFHLFISKSQEI